jgi:hypothetical protein
MAVDLTEARERMVVEQLERRGIKDARVLAAMRSVPRDCFIPAEYADHAYDDGPLPIGSAQTISQPYMVALISEVARCRPASACSKSERARLPDSSARAAHQRSFTQSNVSRACRTVGA